MFDFIKKFFSPASTVDFDELVRNGAKVIDVRTPKEYASGHVPGSINIPLNELFSVTEQFPKDTVLITCCGTGVRAASASNVLRSLGFTNVHNGGGWTTLQTRLAVAS